MYVVDLHGDIKKIYDYVKLAMYKRAGYYTCINYIDAVQYSRAILARGTSTKVASFYFA